jgi:hypothetical protein
MRISYSGNLWKSESKLFRNIDAHYVCKLTGSTNMTVGVQVDYNDEPRNKASDINLLSDQNRVSLRPQGFGVFDTSLFLVSSDYNA